MDRLSDSSTNLLVRAARKARINLYFDRHDYRNTVLLAGAARSGTTWLLELLNFDDYYRSVFEPLHPRLVAGYGFRPIQYLPPDDTDHTLITPLAKILAGRVRSTWTDKFNRKIWVRQRLVKCIRANLLLTWIRVNFPEIAIILLVRHPCAVASSRLKLGLPAPVDQLLAQERLMADHLAPFAALLEKPAEPFEKHILMWCVEHYVPLKQLSQTEICLVFYEHLIRDPEEELKRLCAFAGRPYDRRMLNVVRRPSALTKNHSAILTGKNLVASWQQETRPDQIQRAMELLAIFGLDHLYGPDGWPMEVRVPNP